ncbi:MAG TPA: GIY-YIG nuclease family protein [Brevundimonas sp.]
MAFYVYIVASQRNGTLYIGSTDDLIARISQHRAGYFGGFTARYDVTRLVWFETHGSRDGAFLRERQLKKWKRRWKLQLIDESNPDWTDLFDTVRLGGLKDASDWVPACAGTSGSEKDL